MITVNNQEKQEKNTLPGVPGFRKRTLSGLQITVSGAGGFSFPETFFIIWKAQGRKR